MIGNVTILNATLYRKTLANNIPDKNQQTRLDRKIDIQISRLLYTNIA